MLPSGPAHEEQFNAIDHIDKDLMSLVEWRRFSRSLRLLPCTTVPSSA